MRNEQKKSDQDEAVEALERERLGGPADYDESGGTGLSEAPSGERASGAAGAGSDGQPRDRDGLDGGNGGRGADSTEDVDRSSDGNDEDRGNR